MKTGDVVVTVTQADREAARPFMNRYLDGSSFCEDREDLAKTLARHRARAEVAATERAAKVAESPGFIQARDTEWDEGINHAKRFIAAAIRDNRHAE